MSSLYRISWTAPNGYSGHGEYILTKDEAIIWLEILQHKYPDMTHIYE